MKTYKLIYAVTILSGVAGLVYEITWTRMLVLIFGNSNHSVVAVISAFLGGLAIGSLLIGKWSDRKSFSQLLRLYAVMEFGIAALAILTIFFIPATSQIYAYFSDGTTLTAQLLMIKFLLTTIIILLPTILMGGTLPILVSLLRIREPQLDSNISRLYALNTFGGVIGIIVAALFSIELFGLRGTILVGVLLNLLAGLLISLVPKSSLSRPVEESTLSLPKQSLMTKDFLVLIGLFITGLIAIAYEVLWTRLLTPITGTFTYSFAAILATYLLGIAIGSLIYHQLSPHFKDKKLLFALSELGIGFFALCSVFIITSPINGALMLTLLVILPASSCMGISFPAANALLRGNMSQGGLVGSSYFSNTIGSIIGGFLASFILVPFIGSAQSIIFLALGNFLLAVMLIFLEAKNSPIFKIRALLTLSIILIFFSAWLFIFKRDEIPARGLLEARRTATLFKAELVYKEDNITSVIGMQGEDFYLANLLVDGVPVTGKVLETRLMAHLPIALHPNPRSLLGICLGMGSTYHSALLHNIDVDAVELSPSVAKMQQLFYPEDKMIGSSKGKIIVNDGRNYVNLTDKKYDIVTIDPPPPLNASGTTVLYSEDFYKSLLRILNDRGLVMQWVFLGDVRRDDIQMVIKSFLNVFPQVIAIKSPGHSPGYFLVGSSSEIIINPQRMSQVLSSEVVKNDLAPFAQNISPNLILALITNKDLLLKATKNALPITDDRPRTEYFALRHFFTTAE